MATKKRKRLKRHREATTCPDSWELVQDHETARDEEETSAYDQLLWSIVGKRQKTGKQGGRRRRQREEEKVAEVGESADDSGDEVKSVISEEVVSESGDEGSEEETPATKDTFTAHFETELSQEEVVSMETPASPLAPPPSLPALGLVSWWPALEGREPAISYRSRPLKELQVKQRLASNWNANVKDPFTDLQRHLFAVMNSYKDMLYTQRTFENAEQVRRVYALHAVNHVLKVRSRVLRNNRRLLQAAKEGRTIEEPRDQGLTRPSVLILLPFKNSALHVINTITSLLLAPGQGHVHNQKRFQREYGEEEVQGQPRVHKPSSFTAMFVGNTDDCFRVGVAVKGNIVRLYADFYSADVIVASPLGLRTIIGADGEKNRDYDFLSSVELVVVDQCDVFLMQNWDHLTHVFSHLHCRPTDSHGVDFSRVRMWALNEWSKCYRQTLIFSAFQTPEINSLLTMYCHNYAGVVRADTASENGSVEQVVKQQPQMFTRLHCDCHTHLPDTRLQYFTTQVLPGYLGELMKGTLIFVPSYFDFVRLRNYMKRQELSFTKISEYTTSPDVSRARTQFFHGLRHFLLYTERAHFFRRYQLRGVRHLICYSVPVYPEHYSELVNMVEGEGGTVSVLHSQFDQLALSRVVGVVRAKRMAASKDSNHLIVTGQ